MAWGEPQLQSVQIEVTSAVRERMARMTILEASKIVGVTERMVRFWVKDGMPTNSGEGPTTVDIVTVLGWYSKRCVEQHEARKNKQQQEKACKCTTCGR